MKYGPYMGGSISLKKMQGPWSLTKLRPSRSYCPDNIEDNMLFRQCDLKERSLVKLRPLRSHCPADIEDR